jgi:hypothetical protein
LPASGCGSSNRSATWPSSGSGADQDLGGVASRRAGLGASYQTGWTGIVSLLIEIFGKLCAQTFLQAAERQPLSREGKGVVLDLRNGIKIGAVVAMSADE